MEHRRHARARAKKLKLKKQVTKLNHPVSERMDLDEEFKVPEEAQAGETTRAANIHPL